MSSRRPGSAKSSASSSKRPSISSNRGGHQDRDLVYECKAAYLVFFDSIDENIESRKRLSALMQQCGRNPTKKVLSKYWNEDTESLSFDEFVDICNKEPVTSEDDLMKAFRKIDLNGDGYIDNRELKKVLTTRGERMSSEEVQDIIDEVDENKDGRLDYKEFSKMVLSTQKECQKLALDNLERKEKKGGRHGKNEDTEESVDDDDDSEIVVSSSRSKRSSLTPQKKDMSKPSPRGKERTKSPVAGKDLALPKPKRIKDWKLTHSKGCFFFDEDNQISNHQYEMSLSKETSVYITIEPFSIRPGGDLNSAREVSRSPIDTMLFILRSDNSLVTYTELRDAKGRYGVRCDLEKGRYKLVPFTTGCRFRPRMGQQAAETKLVKKVNNQYLLTKPFKEALNDIFELCDLDGNGTLSRNEFNFFNLRTSGDAVSDEEWDVVEDKLELKNGEITPQGFLQLNQMEADDNEGDTDELWVTLENMGFNKDLTLDESCPFFMEIYSESCEAKLKVTDLCPGGGTLDKAVTESTIGKGESSKIRNSKDVFLHTYINDFRGCLVVENKSSHSVKVELDSRNSDNCTPSTNQLECTVSVPGRSSVIGQHVMPTKETREWTLRCQESIIR